MILPALSYVISAISRIRSLLSSCADFRFFIAAGAVPAVLLLSSGTAWSQVIESLPVSRDGNRVTITVRVTVQGSALQQRTLSWAIENPREGDRIVSTTGATNAKGEATAVVVLGPAAGTRFVVASLPSGIQLAAASVPPTVIRIPVTNDEQAALEGLKTFVVLPQLGLDTAFVQMRNVGRRIREVRTGGPAMSVFGTALGPVPGDIRVMSLSEASEAAAMATARDALGGRFGLFLNGQGSFGTRDETAYTRGYDSRTIGLTGGVDYRFSDNFILGAALGIVRAKSTFNADYGDATANGFAGSVYGSYYHGKFYVDIIGTLGLNRYDTRRALGVGDAQGATNGRQYGGSVSAGWNTNRGAFAFGPYVRAGYIRVDVNDFTESGSTGSEMAVSDQAATSFTTALGGQASYSISRSWGVLTPSVRVEFEHEQRQNVRTLSGSLVADPIRTLFAIPVDTPDSNYFNVGVGLAAQFANGRAAFINYETMLGRSQITNHAVIVGGRVEF